MEQVRGRRWRDMGLRPAYALYALAAFAAATALCIVLSRGLDSVRWSILRRCLEIGRASCRERVSFAV